MSKFRVITDGSGDLTPELIKERDITVVPFYVMLGSGDYLKQDVDIGTREFYEWMVSHPGVYPKSSTPSTQDFLKVFREVAEAGDQAICICITEKFSNSYQTARIALELLREDYPDAKIAVYNSMVNTVLQGLYVLEACDLRDAGFELDEAVKRLEEIRPTGRIFFTIGSMSYLSIGGRIGKLAGKVSTVLGIRPIITLKEGEIFPSGVCRGRGKSLDKVINVSREYLKQTCSSADELSIAVGYGYDYNEAAEFQARISALLDELGLSKADIPIRLISSVIAVHTGPYPLGIGVLRKARLDK